MIKVGLTGGIGSGKSIVAEIFYHLGIPVYNSDIEAKNLYKTDKVLKTLIIRNFGKQAFLDSGEVNKDFLISSVFPNQAKLEILNKLVHPRVKINFENWLGKHRHSKIVIKEAAILFESGAYKQLDKIIAVTAPDAIRIKRVMKRDSVTDDSVRKRMLNQWPQEKLVANADFIIDNSGLKSVIKQVLRIYNDLIS